MHNFLSAKRFRRRAPREKHGNRLPEHPSGAACRIARWERGCGVGAPQGSCSRSSRGSAARRQTKAAIRAKIAPRVRSARAASKSARPRRYRARSTATPSRSVHRSARAPHRASRSTATWSFPTTRRAASRVAVRWTKSTIAWLPSPAHSWKKNTPARVRPTARPNATRERRRVAAAEAVAPVVQARAEAPRPAELPAEVSTRCATSPARAAAAASARPSAASLHSATATASARPAVAEVA